jgi:hypothetical protein
VAIGYSLPAGGGGGLFSGGCAVLARVTVHACLQTGMDYVALKAAIEKAITTAL